jgi:uncharacterized protein YbjT (DUF2867 family)
MAILIVPGDLQTSDEFGEVLAMRLVDQGDDVRVLGQARDDADGWRRFGARPALGDPRDPDLIERASQGVRSIVLISSAAADVDIAGAAIDGGKAAGVDRLIVCADLLDKRVNALVRGSGLDHVLLQRARRLGPLNLRGIKDADAAAAVDAADDMDGNPKLELDLTRKESWAALNLEPPT